MKRIISTCALVLILTGVFSCDSGPPPDKPGSSVWQVSRKGNTLFLGGSIHILRDTDFPLPKEYDQAFSKSSILVLEADIEQMAGEEITQYITSRMLLPDDITLQLILDTDTYETLRVKCNEYGFTINNVSKFKPSMVITILTLFQIQEFGFTRQGVDIHYLEMARSENKPVEYLETVKTQIDALVAMGDGYENDYVRYSLNDLENTENGITTLLTDWRRGAASSTETTLAEMKEKWPEIYKTMLTDRNAAWMPQLEKFLASEQVYFVIVGLAHLHGPDGLLRHLKKSGCKVKRVR